MAPELKKYVEDPELLRIADEDMIDPRLEAAVQVTSQEECNKIVSHLVELGMLEREIEEETLR